MNVNECESKIIHQTTVCGLVENKFYKTQEIKYTLRYCPILTTSNILLKPVNPTMLCFWRVHYLHFLFMIVKSVPLNCKLTVSFESLITNQVWRLKKIMSLSLD